MATPATVVPVAGATGHHGAHAAHWSAGGGTSSRTNGSMSRGSSLSRPPSIGRSGAAAAGRAMLGAPAVTPGGATSSAQQPSIAGARTGSGSVACGTSSEEIRGSSYMAPPAAHRVPPQSQGEGRQASRSSSNGVPSRTPSRQPPGHHPTASSHLSAFATGDGGDILSQILMEAGGGAGTQSASLAGVPRRAPELDFDDEARKLWARLNLDPSATTGGLYNALDPIWRHPTSGATLYVGNQTAAKSLALLQQHQITHVVNCTDSMPLYHEKPGSPITYYRFDITSYRRRVASDEAAVAFVQPMLDFVSPALESGHCVMVHCLAGAHRAGTTGIMCLMHFARLNARDAVIAAKRCRPIIDPIGDFPELLRKVERGWKAMGRTFS